MGATALAIAIAAIACSSRDSQPLSDDGGVKRRVFNPPPSKVRAMPPHNIHAEGIGPYQLKAPLKQILSTLPHGPRIELFRLGNLADFSLVRSEGGALLVGVERGSGVTFVASVGAKIARTETGVGVGSDLVKAGDDLGEPWVGPTVIRDPRLHRYRQLPGVLFVSDGTRGAKKEQVGAVLVDGVGVKPSDGEPGETPEIPACTVDEKLASRVSALARLGDTARIRYACTDEGAPIVAVATRRDRLVWLPIDKDKARRGSSTTIAGLRFAAPIRLDDRVAIVAISEERTAGELRIRADVFRAEGTRLANVVTRRIYTVSRDAVTWVGGALAGIEVPVEVSALGAAKLEVRGFYTERRTGRVVMVAPLSPRSLKLTRRKPASEADAGPADTDAGDRADAAAEPRAPIGPR